MHSQQQAYQFEGQQVRSELIQLSPTKQHQATLKLYKIFGEAQFSYEAAHGRSLVDWSGFYTQYNPIHSMRYLTKKWGDGSDFACLIKLYLNHDNQSSLKLIKVSHSSLGKHSIEGKVKTNLIKRHMKQKYGIDFGEDDEYPLLRRLGEKGIILQCVDCDEEEVIIPHDLLTKQNFIFQGLVTYQKSNDGFLRTIRWKRYNNVEEWHSVKGQQEFEPHLLINSCPELHKVVYQ